MRIKDSKLARRFGSGVAWNLGGTVGYQIFNVVGWIVTARILGRTSYGEVGMIQSTVGMLALFAGLGVGTTAAKYVAEHRASDPRLAEEAISTTLTVAVVTSLLAGLPLLLLPHFVAVKMLSAPALAQATAISSILLIGNGISGAQNGVLAGLESFKSMAIITITRSLVQLPLMIGLGYYAGVLGVTTALAIGAAVTVLTSHLLIDRAAKEYGLKVGYLTRHLNQPMLRQFALPALLSNLVSVPAFWYVNYLLVQKPSGYGEMGTLTVATTWRTMVLFIPAILSQVLMPVASSMNNARESGSMRKLFLLSTMTNTVVCLPLALIGYFGRNLIAMLYGKQFDGSGLIIFVMLLSAVAKAISGPADNIIQAKGKMWASTLVNSLLAVILVAFCWTLLEMQWGAMAVAASYLAAYAISGFVLVLYAMKLLKEAPAAA